MAKCEQCKYYGDGWCHRYSIHAEVILDREACKSFEKRTSMDEKCTKVITIDLPRYETLIRNKERLDIARAILAKADIYESERLKLVRSVLLEKEPCTTPKTT